MAKIQLVKKQNEIAQILSQVIEQSELIDDQWDGFITVPDHEDGENGYKMLVPAGKSNLVEISDQACIQLENIVDLLLEQDEISRVYDHHDILEKLWYLVARVVSIPNSFTYEFEEFIKKLRTQLPPTLTVFPVFGVSIEGWGSQ